MTYRFYARWLIGGIVMLLIVAGACYLWYQHDIAPYKQEAADAEKLLRQSEKSKKVSKTGNTAQQATDVTPAESETPPAEKPITEVTAEVENTIEEETQQQSENAEATDVRVSPHGFGPYPTLPLNWPQDFWDTPKSIDHELHARVWIKLLGEGKHVQGMTTHGRLVYPIIKGLRYVKWEEGPTPPDGKIRRYVGRNTGHPDDDLPKDKYGFTFESDIPPSIHVISYKDGGINPYTYLNLKE